MEEKGKKGRMDYTLLLIVVLLVVIGLVILYSTSAYNGQVKFHDSFYYLKKQAFATVLGIVLMLFVAGMDYHIWQRLAVFGYLAAVALSVAVMLFGREINGSKRWLALGPFSFQPSEFAKVALILFLADLVTKNVKTIGKMWTLCRIMFWILPIVGLVGASNLSTAIIMPLKAIGWNGLLSGEIRKNMKRVIRPCRGFTRLDPEEYSESGSETVYRSWDLYLRHRMI